MTENEKAISILEELQQYRALGTPEELKELKELKERAFDGMELAQIAAALMRLKEYERIGTPEECRAAVAVKKEVQDIVDRLEELKEEKTIGSHKVMIKEAIEIVRGEADA